MRCEAQIARFWLRPRRVSQNGRINPKPVSTVVENGSTLKRFPYTTKLTNCDLSPSMTNEILLVIL